MREGGEEVPFEIQRQRDTLAQEVREMKRKRDAKRRESGTFRSKVLGKSKILTQEAEALNLEAKQRLAHGIQAIEHAFEGYRLGLKELESVSTDQNLLRWYYKHFKKNPEAHPVATDTFIEKSKEEYNAAWLSRELVQNFVDHNPKQRGTLNGVSTQREILEDEKTVRYTITGEWPFEDPTGTISPHVEKPAEVYTAGGHGIGLKQTAIRYLRDFGVKRFDIQGENWTTSYELAKAEEINQALEQMSSKAEQPIAQTMRHDWLVANLKPTEQSGKVVYVIETDNPEIISTLDQLEDIGVHDRNRFLQNPDFVNENGKIKWLPPLDGQEQKGRLFINGQVMNFGSKGESDEKYWVGPEYVTLQLNSIPYKMSIDRPPVQPYELGWYMQELIGSMSVEEIFEQLQKAEPIWTLVNDERAGGMIVVKSLVQRLNFNSDHDKKDFGQYFPNKKYLARDSGLSPTQEQDLIRQGYILCPYYFADIGMPQASSRLGSFELAINERPNIFRADLEVEKIAEESGIPISYEDLGKLKPEQLLTLIKERLAWVKPEIVYNAENPQVLRMKLDVAIPKELLSRLLVKPNTAPQKTLHFLRGVAFYGLNERIFRKFFWPRGSMWQPLARDMILLLKRIRCMHVTSKRQVMGSLLNLSWGRNLHISRIYS